MKVAKKICEWKVGDQKGYQNLRGGVGSGPSSFSVDKVQTIVFNKLTTPLS